MIGITELVKEINQKSKVNNQQVVKKVLDTFVETIKQKLNKNESISFKGNFLLRRSVIISKDKKCAKHIKSMANMKKTSKGKGLVAFSKLGKFRDLVQEIRSCKDCKKQRKESIKSAKLNKRIIFEPRELFWITPRGKKGKK